MSNWLLPLSSYFAEFAGLNPIVHSDPAAERLLTKALLSKRMLYTIAVILLILWLLGLVSSYTLGGVIHILLVVAVVMVVISLLQGRRGP